MMSSILMIYKMVLLVPCQILEGQCMRQITRMWVPLMVIVTYWLTLWRMETLNMYQNLQSQKKG